MREGSGSVRDLEAILVELDSVRSGLADRAKESADLRERQRALLREARQQTSIAHIATRYGVSRQELSRIAQEGIDTPRSAR